MSLAAKNQLKAALTESKHQRLTRKFLLVWKSIGGANVVPEYQFHPTRKWRFDFCCPVSMVAIEIEGGHRSGGRHTRPEGFEEDCEKYFAAAEAGFLVFRIVDTMINVQFCQRISNKIKSAQDALEKAGV